jgi:hypothetical protein
MSSTKAAALVQAALVALDGRSQANGQKRTVLIGKLAAGDLSVLDEAQVMLDEEAAIEAERLLALEAKRLVDAELQRVESERANRNLEKEKTAFEALKLRRLAIAATVERQLRVLASNLVKLDSLAADIASAHRRLGGERLIVPPLSPSATGSRISEFCAGLGLHAWLPVMCVETKSPPRSFEEAERAAQAEYRLTEDR